MIQELSTVFVFIKILLKWKWGGVQFINRPGLSMECPSVCFRSDTDESTRSRAHGACDKDEGAGEERLFDCSYCLASQKPAPAFKTLPI